MLSQRWRPVLFSTFAVLGIWILAMVGYHIAKNARMTAEKVRTYAGTVDLSKLSAEARAKAIRKLADMLNALSLEERRKARLERLAWPWLEQLSEEEKAGFIEATMRTGFKQMLDAFEKLREDKRRKSIDDALRQLREAQNRLQNSTAETVTDGTNGPPPLSQELQAKIRT